MPACPRPPADGGRAQTTHGAEECLDTACISSIIIEGSAFDRPREETHMETAKPKRNRATSVLVDFGALRGTLGRLAAMDAVGTGESPNMSRTVRLLVIREAERRGLTKPRT
jgi:hypothetical protein